MVLRIDGWRHCDRPPSVRVGPYIPLSVRWGTDTDVELCYLMIEGARGGYVEVKVDRESGVVAEVVVVIAPEPASVRPAVGWEAVEPRRPVVDLARWSFGPQDLPAVARGHADLGYERSGRTSLLTVGDEAAHEVHGCGDVRIGVTANRELAWLAARTP